MFHTIPEQMLARMDYLETADAQDRLNGTPQARRLRQIPPETGKFLALLAANAVDGRILEIGTSAGYSTMWISLACRPSRRRITTFEVLDNKVALAQETFSQAGIDDLVELVHGDARDHLASMDMVAYCFLDAEKDVYEHCYDLVVPNLVPGGLLLADNAINHAAILKPFLDRATSDPRVDALVVPVGKGVLLCRKI